MWYDSVNHMRLIGTILSALSLLLLLGVLFFWMRSYSNYEGVAWFREGKDLTPATWTQAGTSETWELPGRSRGILSYKGQLTYASIANPLISEPQEFWSHPLKEELTAGKSAALMFDAKNRAGITFGSDVTRHDLIDINGKAWKLPYHFVTTPYWMLAILLALPPYFWISNYRLLAKREREGRCLKCGTPLAGADKCANCGTLND